MVKESRFRKLITQLALALVNATLLLALLLAVVLFLLFGRVQDLAAKARDTASHGLAVQAEQLEKIGSEVRQIKARLQELDEGDAQELSDEIDALRASIERARTDVVEKCDVVPIDMAAKLKQMLGESLLRD